MIRIGVIGALGRMGRMVCATVADDPDLNLVAVIDRSHIGEPIGPVIGRSDIPARVSDEMDTLLQAEVEVAIDFTHPDVVMTNIQWCIEHAVNVVVGTTGLTETDLHGVEDALEAEGGESNVFVAPNFAVGAVLAERFAVEAARYFPSVEIIELHHEKKADAPSGTSLSAARKIAEARREAPQAPQAPAGEALTGARGAIVEGIHVHSVRLPGLMAHEEIIFGGQGQTLTIRQDSLDRSSFMQGVVLAVKAVATLPGLTVGLDEVLQLATSESPEAGDDGVH